MLFKRANNLGFRTNLPFHLYYSIEKPSFSYIKFKFIEADLASIFPNELLCEIINMLPSDYSAFDKEANSVKFITP